jgi:signal transduction histidine kinase
MPRKKLLTEVYFIVDRGLNIIEWDERFVNNDGSTETDLHCLSFFAIFPELNNSRINRIIHEVIDKEKFNCIEKELIFSLKKRVFSIDFYPKGKNVLIFMKDISEKKEAVKALQKSKRELRALASHLQNVREAERRFIAMEIHDDLGQKLTAMQIELGLLLKKIESSRVKVPNEVFIDIEKVNDLINEALDSKHGLLTKFRIDFLEELGLMDAAKLYLDEFQKRYNIRYYFYSDWSQIELSYEKSLALYRILQEALTNVAKHSEATEVDISFEDRNNRVVMSIEDNGKGISDKARSETEKLGILGMEERALISGGTFSIRGIPGGGTRVRVSAKINDEGKV